MLISIALDGPVGAGKSTVAHEVAKELGILHLDTGALYRAFTWLLLEKKINIHDENTVCSLLNENQVTVSLKDNKQLTYINGQEVSDYIRTPEISMATSVISTYKEVRKKMTCYQQDIAKKHDILLDGRDIGTNVLPNATIKIFLTAKPEERARRRLLELNQKDPTIDFESVLADVIKRDEQDTTREIDPLKPAEDAQILDVTYLDKKQVIQEIVRRVRYVQGSAPKREERFYSMYSFVRRLCIWMFCTIFPVKFHNVENILLDAPYILIGNHLSMFDPLLLLPHCHRYQLRFLSKKELMKIPILSKWLLKAGVVPVDRQNSDLKALRACLKVIASNKPLAIFPEGTRMQEGGVPMENIHSGTAMIALRSNAVLVPVYISGIPKLFKKTHVYYGKPIFFAKENKNLINKSTCDLFTEEIKQVYSKMEQEHFLKNAK